MTRKGRTKKEKPPFEPGLIPAPGELLVWRDGQHFDRWQDLPCELCDQPTPMRSHSGEPVHKACAEGWIAANPVEARLGRFASDLAPKPKSKGQGDHA
ncbi:MULTISPECIES: hypothetical protein [Streptomyces]|uniref:hypothetical protein n=1 Tax=Streptomyces TaxID=1883 RepID=UPI0004E71D8A|nr:hypothetical protein [Streptomyces scabiei]KFG06947.1 hypothetical protein IQ61_22050 [Streptomyces scabiei]MDX2835456.1 hypothetical protein [Streptomyces scabiei]MDX3680500.1 hypothetical protein [Streptomyces scabiei]